MNQKRKKFVFETEKWVNQEKSYSNTSFKWTTASKQHQEPTNKIKRNETEDDNCSRAESMRSRTKVSCRLTAQNKQPKKVEELCQKKKRVPSGTFLNLKYQFQDRDLRQKTVSFSSDPNSCYVSGKRKQTEVTSSEPGNMEYFSLFKN